MLVLVFFIISISISISIFISIFNAYTDWIPNLSIYTYIFRFGVLVACTQSEDAAARGIQWQSQSKLISHLKNALSKMNCRHARQLATTSSYIMNIPWNWYCQDWNCPALQLIAYRREPFFIREENGHRETQRKYRGKTWSPISVQFQNYKMKIEKHKYVD